MLRLFPRFVFRASLLPITSAVSLLFIAFMLIMANGCQKSGVSASEETSQRATARLSGPDQQKYFCELLRKELSDKKRLEAEHAEFATRYPLKADDINAKTIQLFVKMFDDLYATIGPSGAFNQWRGKLKVFQGVDDAGKRSFSLAFTPNCFSESDGVFIFNLATGTGVLGSTDIGADSPLGKSLQEMDPNKEVTVSGEFLWAPPPPKHGMWVPGIETRYHFYMSPNQTIAEGYYSFFVRILQIS